MDDFRFRGKHVSEFGAVAAFGDTMAYGGKAKRGEYALPGGGSVLIGEDAWEKITRKVVIMPADGIQADGDWRREIVSWLQAGRGEMIVDNDPDVILLASFDADGTYGHREWPAGCLAMNMAIHPLAYAALETQRTVHVQGGVKNLTSLDIQSAMPVPLRIQMKPTGETVTRLCISCGGKVLNLPNLALKKGQILEYDAGTFLGDVTNLAIDGATDFGPVQGGSWARLVLDPARGVLDILTEGGAADVTISARGRWPA